MKFKHLLLAGVLSITIVMGGCGDSKSDKKDEKEPAITPTVEATLTEAPTVEPADTPVTELTTAPTNEPQKYQYEINYHQISKWEADYFDQDALDAAHRMIDAFLSGENQIEVKNWNMGKQDHFEVLVAKMCPPCMALMNFEGQKEAYANGSGVIRAVDIYTEEFRKEEIKKFEDGVAHYLDGVYEGDSDVMKAALIFQVLSKESIYIHELEGDGTSNFTLEEIKLNYSGHGVITRHTGVCIDFTHAYNFLLGQVGIEAVHVASDIPSHAWSLVKIDGLYYHCDPTWAISNYPDMVDMSYFGMTEQDRINSGNGSEFPIGENKICDWFDYPEELKASDDRFAGLHEIDYRYIIEFEPDHENQTIRVKSNLGGEYIIK